jgi:spore coat polysaccharide biosynthesis protein SpsF (cytidylyltransferase family)
VAKGTKGGRINKERLEVSPGGSIFTGPIISEVVQTVKEAQTNSKIALCTSKRKYGDEVVELGLKKKKKKIPKGDGKIVEKERKLNGNSTNESGSGVVEAAGQPHRPQ